MYNVMFFYCFYLNHLAIQATETIKFDFDLISRKFTNSQRSLGLIIFGREKPSLYLSLSLSLSSAVPFQAGPGLQ